MRTVHRGTLAILLFASAFFLVVLSSGITQPPGRAASGALEALSFWNDARAYPYADIPADKYYRAFERAKALGYTSSGQVAAAEPWQFLGPLNFSGRMISIAVDPTNSYNVYVGSASGGLWHSITGGTQGDWVRVPTGFPVLGVGAITISPADPNVLYIGTGETYSYGGSVGGMVVRTTRGSYGMGILKTTDAGATWTKSLDWTYNNRRGVQAIRINPQNPSTVIAATSEGVYRTSNAGATWALALGVLMAQDILINPIDTTLVLASCGNFGSPGTGIYLSGDGGVSFDLVADLPFSGKTLLESFAAHPNVVYASVADSINGSGMLLMSVNFGVSWDVKSSVAVHGVQGWYSHFVAVHPVDSSLIVRGGQTAAYRSTNGGRTFNPVYATWADLHSYAHDPTDPNVLYIVDDGGVWRSGDFGGSYQYVGSGLETSQFYNGSSSSATDSLLAIGSVQDHFAWIYHGTLQWLSSPGGDEVGWTAINQKNAGTIYAGGRNGSYIERSVDHGVLWTSISTGFSGFAAWNTPFVLSPSDTSVLYFGKSIIYKSTNRGSNWAATNGGAVLDGNPPLSMAISYTSSDTVYVGTAPWSTAAHLFRTTNGGATWTNITGVIPNRYPMDLAVDPKNSRVVYAAMGGFGTGHAFKSTDVGATWVDLTGSLPDVPATALLVDPAIPSHVYIGTDLGVYVSTDGGMSWMPFNDGLPEAVIVGDLTLSSSNRMLRVFTHSCGVYQRPLLEEGATGVIGLSAGVPDRYALAQNYPNPFNPTTSIEYSIPVWTYSSTSLRVYDLLGREVAVLVDERKAPGSYSVRFDAGGLASGIYLCRLVSGEYSQVKKMVLMK